MSEEEKQAIEILKQEPDFSLSYYKREKAIDIVLNLIEKQQKEIEEYKKRLTPTPDNCVPIEYQMIGYVDKRGYISKDKIREKIKYWQKERHIAGEHLVVQVLQELLGEGE